MSIEKQAVNRISAAFDSCPRLDATIDTGDKTPFTDGHIELYSDADHRNENSQGRVPVQVKGRKEPAAKAKRASYQIRTVDLRAYLKMRGALYFVVNIDRDDPATRHPFYALLNPFRIAELLEGVSPGQKSITVPLEPLPSGTSKLQAIVRQAIVSMQQSPEQGFDPVLMENLSQITLRGIEPLDLDAPVTFSANGPNVAVFAKTVAGMEVAVPGVFSVTPEEYRDAPLDIEISAGGVSFVSPRRRRVDKDTVVLTLSETLRLTLKETKTGSTGNLDFSSSDNLGQRLRDLEFFLGCVDERGFRIDSTLVSMKGPSGARHDDLHRHLAYLKKLEELFGVLDVPADLVDVGSIDETRWQQLGIVYSALFQEKSLGDYVGETGRLWQPIGEMGLEFFVLETGEGRRLIDAFSSDTQLNLWRRADTDDGQSFSHATPYEFLDGPDFARTLNLHLASIADSYASLPEPNDASSMAVETVLHLLQASDIDERRRDEFLDAAASLNDWLLEQEGRQPHLVVNRMQIIARARELADAERKEVRALRRDAIRGETPLPTQVELSCAILLSDPAGIEDARARLEPEEFEQYQQWPIWTLAPKTPTPAKDASSSGSNAL